MLFLTAMVFCILGQLNIFEMKKQKVKRRPLSKFERENLEKTLQKLYPGKTYGDAILRAGKDGLLGKT